MITKNEIEDMSIQFDRALKTHPMSAVELRKDLVDFAEQVIKKINIKKYRELLADELNAYIKNKHSQEECIGFINGFERLCDILENNSIELFNNTNISNNINTVGNAKDDRCIKSKNYNKL